MIIKFLYQNCDPVEANNRQLPYNTYIVKYEDEGEIKYDIVQSNKQADIFDYYWDKYREGLKSFKQTEGRVNPKLYGNQSPEKKKGKNAG